jgi:hypothetical protein
VELFEQIRREYEFGVGTIAGVSRKLGVHRRVWCGRRCTVPSPHRRSPNRDDLGSWTRQRSSSTRFCERMFRHRPSSGIRHVGFSIASRPNFPDSAAVNVRFVAMCSAGGSSWGWNIGKSSCHRRTRGARKRRWTGTKPASGAAYHRAYTRATQQAFLESHRFVTLSMGADARDRIPRRVRAPLARPTYPRRISISNARRQVSPGPSMLRGS